MIGDNHWNTRYLKYSQDPKSREGYEYAAGGKRYKKNETYGDTVVCVDDSSQKYIKNGKSYIIADTENLGMRLKGLKNEVYYRYDRFMSESDYRELMISEILE